MTVHLLLWMVLLVLLELLSVRSRLTGVLRQVLNSGLRSRLGVVPTGVIVELFKTTVKRYRISMAEHLPGGVLIPTMVLPFRTAILPRNTNLLPVFTLNVLLKLLIWLVLYGLPLCCL